MASIVRSGRRACAAYTPAFMSRFPVELAEPLATRLRDAFDREGKIVRALEALGPVAGRDVLVIDGDGSPVATGLAEVGARVTAVGLAADGRRIDAPDASADVVVGLWSAFRDVDAEAIAEADRVLRPGGRLLAVHDYGRDDVSRLYGQRPEYGPWSHRRGPYLTGGFRIRVLHCFWTFDSADATSAFLEDAFGAPGAALAATLKRSRLSYNVAVYHRWQGGAAEPGSAAK